jgi:hypothetical protein
MQRFASRVSESSARPQVRVKGARLQNGAQPGEQKRVQPLRGSGRNHADVVGLPLWISVILRLWLSMTSPKESDNL